MKKSVLVLLLVLLSSVSSSAESPFPGKRSILVSGNAESSMPANEVTVSVKIRTVNDDLAEAQKNSKAVFDKLLKDLAPLGVKLENVQLQDHELGKEYEDGPDGQRLWKGFYSSRSFKVVLGDVEKLELVHAELAENPDLELNGTSYSRTDQIKIRKKLREDALEAAREKAMAMAAVYQLKLGPVLTIEEESGFGYGFLSNTVTRNTGVNLDVEGSARGKVTLSAIVSVVFELID